MAEMLKKWLTTSIQFLTNSKFRLINSKTISLGGSCVFTKILWKLVRKYWNALRLLARISSGGFRLSTIKLSLSKVVFCGDSYFVYGLVQTTISAARRRFWEEHCYGNMTTMNKIIQMCSDAPKENRKLEFNQNRYLQIENRSDKWIACFEPKPISSVDFLIVILMENHGER